MNIYFQLLTFSIFQDVVTSALMYIFPFLQQKYTALALTRSKENMGKGAGGVRFV